MDRFVVYKIEDTSYTDGSKGKKFTVTDNDVFVKRTLVISRINKTYDISTYFHGEQISIEHLSEDNFKLIIKQMQGICED